MCVCVCVCLDCVGKKCSSDIQTPEMFLWIQTDHFIQISKSCKSLQKQSKQKHDQQFYNNMHCCILHGDQDRSQTSQQTAACADSSICKKNCTTMISMQLLHAHDTKQPTQIPFCSALVTFFASCSPSKTEKVVDLTPYPMFSYAICRFVMWGWGG